MTHKLWLIHKYYHETGKGYSSHLNRASEWFIERIFLSALQLNGEYRAQNFQPNGGCGFKCFWVCSKSTIPDLDPSRILPRLVSKINFSKIHYQSRNFEIFTILDIVKILLIKYRAIFGSHSSDFPLFDWIFDKMTIFPLQSTLFQVHATRQLRVYTVKTTQCWIHYRIDAWKM